MASQATAVINKNDQADQLRGQVRTLTAELTKIRADLAIAAGSLAVLQEKKRVMAEEIADGKTHKPTVIASLHADIEAAELPVSALQRRVTERDGQLAQTRDALATLDREIAIEANQAARRARYQELEKEITDAASVICEDVRLLIEEHLVRFDTARDALTREFIGQFTQITGPEGRAARELIHRVMQSWMDGSRLAVTRRLLRASPEWKERGDITIEISNLRPPKP